MKTKTLTSPLPNTSAILSLLFLTSALVLLSISAMAQEKKISKNINVDLNMDVQKVFEDHYKGNGSYVKDIETPAKGRYQVKISGGNLVHQQDVSVR